MISEQLDGLEREANGELRLGQSATCVLVQPEDLLHLVAIARAALAWSEARRRAIERYTKLDETPSEKDSSDALISALNGAPCALNGAP